MDARIADRADSPIEPQRSPPPSFDASTKVAGMADENEPPYKLLVCPPAPRLQSISLSPPYDNEPHHPSTRSTYTPPSPASSSSSSSSTIEGDQPDFNSLEFQDSMALTLRSPQVDFTNNALKTPEQCEIMVRALRTYDRRAETDQMLQVLQMHSKGLGGEGTQFEVSFLSSGQRVLEPVPVRRVSPLQARTRDLRDRLASRGQALFVRAVEEGDEEAVGAESGSKRFEELENTDSDDDSATIVLCAKKKKKQQKRSKRTRDRKRGQAEDQAAEDNGAQELELLDQGGGLSVESMIEVQVEMIAKVEDDSDETIRPTSPTSVDTASPPPRFHDLEPDPLQVIESSEEREEDTVSASSYIPDLTPVDLAEPTSPPPLHDLSTINMLANPDYFDPRAPVTVNIPRVLPLQRPTRISAFASAKSVSAGASPASLATPGSTQNLNGEAVEVATGISAARANEVGIIQAGSQTLLGSESVWKDVTDGEVSPTGNVCKAGAPLVFGSGSSDEVLPANSPEPRRLPPPAVSTPAPLGPIPTTVPIPISRCSNATDPPATADSTHGTTPTEPESPGHAEAMVAEAAAAASTGNGAAAIEYSATPVPTALATFDALAVAGVDDDEGDVVSAAELEQLTSFAPREPAPVEEAPEVPEIQEAPQSEPSSPTRSQGAAELVTPELAHEATMQSPDVVVVTPSFPLEALPEIQLSDAVLHKEPIVSRPAHSVMFLIPPYPGSPLKNEITLTLSPPSYSQDESHVVHGGDTSHCTTNSWSLLFSDSDKAKSAHRKSQQTAEAYQTALVHLFSASTLEDLFGCWKALRRRIAFNTKRSIEEEGMPVRGTWGLGIQGMKDEVNFHFFKEGVKPMWEDRLCAWGGKFMYSGRAEHMDSIFFQIALLLVSSELDERVPPPPESDSHVVGVTISRRSTQCRIEIWLGGSSALEQNWIQKVQDVFQEEFKGEKLYPYKAFHLNGPPSSLFTKPNANPGVSSLSTDQPKIHGQGITPQIRPVEMSSALRIGQPVYGSPPVQTTPHGLISAPTRHLQPLHRTASLPPTPPGHPLRPVSALGQPTMGLQLTPPMQVAHLAPQGPNFPHYHIQPRQSTQPLQTIQPALAPPPPLGHMEPPFQPRASVPMKKSKSEPSLPPRPSQSLGGASPTAPTGMQTRSGLINFGSVEMARIGSEDSHPPGRGGTRGRGEVPPMGRGVGIRSGGPGRRGGRALMRIGEHTP